MYYRQQKKDAAAQYEQQKQEAAERYEQSRKEAAGRYERLQKHSDKQTRSLQQQIKRLGEDLIKAQKALSEDLKRDLLAMIKADWKAKYPEQPLSQDDEMVFVDAVESTVANLLNYEYTPDGGLKMWGDAGTIAGSTKGEIPPIFINPDVEKDLGT